MQFDLDSFTYDEEWLRSVAQIEDAYDDVSVGVSGAALGSLLENPADYSRVIAAQMLVIRVWKDWVREWSLGIGTESAQRKGRQLLLERLKTADADIQEQLLSLADEKHAQPQGEWQLTEAHQRTIRQAIESVFTKEDWSVIADSASNRIHDQVIIHPVEALSA